MSILVSLSIIGGILVCVWVVRFVWATYCLFLRREMDLPARYGKGSYALITGAGAGIGKGFSLALAERGFNLIVVDRDIQALEKLINEVAALNNVHVRILQVDFDEAVDKDFFRNIESQLGNLDISVLVNNVGMARANTQFHLIGPETNCNMMIINMLPMVLLSQLLVNRFLQRKKRSAIINLSAEAGLKPLPGLAVYSATKSFARHFSMATAAELADKIDILALRPLNVQSAQLNIGVHGYKAIMGRQCAEACLKQLGYKRETSGHWIHCLQSWVHQALPDFLRDWIWLNKVTPAMMSISERSLADSFQNSTH